MKLHKALVRPSRLTWSIVILVSIAGNVLLERGSRYLDLPLFMDTIFTAVAAVTVGLAATVVVGAGTNITLDLLSGPQMVFAPFVLNNVLTGILVWLFMRYNYFHKPVHAVTATLIVAGLNSALGAVFAAVFLTGDITHSVEHIATGIMLTGRSPVIASFLARIPVNTVDKGMAVFAAYFVYTRLIRGQQFAHEQRFEGGQQFAHDTLENADLDGTSK